MTHNRNRSDGPQPHRLTIHFIKRVGIRDIRFYVDAQADESYTPTKIIFKAGTGENNLIEFATMTLESPMGWQKVPVEGAGGGPDGNTLFAWVLQMHILENHQNGKDTHLRGIRIYAQDVEAAAATEAAAMADIVSRNDVENDASDEDAANGILLQIERDMAEVDWTANGTGLPHFMRDQDLR